MANIRTGLRRGFNRAVRASTKLNRKAAKVLPSLGLPPNDPLSVKKDANQKAENALRKLRIKNRKKRKDVRDLR